MAGDTTTDDTTTDDTTTDKGTLLGGTTTDDTKTDDTTTDDTKTDDTTTDDTKTDDTTTDVPKKYEDFTLPEGTEFSEEGIAKITKYGKDNNLSQGALQGMVDIGLEAIQENVAAYDTHMQEQWGEVREGWVNEIKADKELGGDKLPETIKFASSAVRTFGKEVPVLDDKGVPVVDSRGQPQTMNDLAHALDITGAGDNPVLVRVFAQLGKLAGEGGIIHGNMTSDGRGLGQRLFDKSDMNP